ncbi:MAG: hypothetical protein JO112_00040 [Planctomycetes bacterium]|nr:hypothetical protein [Planctomycetota bacterium]
MIRKLSLLCTLGILFAFSAGVAQAQESAEWGTIQGQVVWAGDQIPPRMPLEISQDKEHCLAKGPILSENLIVNPANKGVKNVFVWLVSDPPTPAKKLPVNPALAKPKENQAVLDQPTCMFVPHALVLRQGQDLLAKNSAPVSHNIKWEGVKNAGGNVLLPPGGSYTIEGLKAERLPLHIQCNIHPWMSAWVGVFDHPYVALTDENGKFEIKGAPAGKLRLVAWQESMGYRGGAAGRNGTPIEVKGGQVTDLGQLELKPRAE